ncbi:hypothetical protein ACQ4LE_004900 [Meloidogyne hapla]
MRDLNSLYFQIKNKGLILYTIYKYQLEFNTEKWIVLNEKELEDCKKLENDEKITPIVFEHLNKIEEDIKYSKSILNNVYWIIEDKNGFLNKVTGKYIKYNH